MTQRKQLTSRQWQIMHYIWDRNEPASIRDVLENVYPDESKAYTTVQTIMETLVDNGFLSKEKIGLVRFYQPTAPKEQVLQEETRSFIRKAYRGSTVQFINHFLSKEALSQEEIHLLKRLIQSESDQ